MAKKYYAVRKGKTEGIYMSWDDCRAQVEGVPGAQYKSFRSIQEAAVYMGDTDREDRTAQTDKEGKPVTDRLNAVAYVDGSYNSATREFSYGVVMFHDGKELHFSDKSDDDELAKMRNVAGEIKGAECAMRYAAENGCDTLVIYHDYEGIAKWCTGEWKTGRIGTAQYKRNYEEFSGKVDISFVKVKGHSGDKYNDKADELAKKALTT